MGSDLYMESLAAEKQNKLDETHYRHLKLNKKDVLDCAPIWSFRSGYERRYYSTPKEYGNIETFWELKLGIPVIITSAEQWELVKKYFDYLNDLPEGPVNMEHLGMYSKYEKALPIWKPNQ